MRKETKVKRARERGANSSLSSSYLEPEREDGSDDENAISLSAIKNKFNKKSSVKGDFFSVVIKTILSYNKFLSIILYFVYVTSFQSRFPYFIIKNPL